MNRLPTAFTVFLLVALVASGCNAPAEATDANQSKTESTENTETAKTETANSKTSSSDANKEDKDSKKMPELETITFGAGCFWCIEAVLDRIEGVHEVTSGYMGGQTIQPTYREVCTGLTGHAEVVEVKFDPKKLPLDKLLDIFWQLHDPTTLNRQGPDVGTQYRSAIFYHSDEQKAAAEKSKEKWNESRKFRGKIVTEITEASEFYEAEEYHQEYFARNPNDRYCRYNILPKFKKLGLLKKSDL
ncbi:MAG: peptide-methionine (S)-S-oxide reductase MsrA [Planctomycetales bacterium]|nr:peptide-methionine (S)-S-oxide reductase MsrA [Planctomycetales bacterium]